ncbi:MAG: NADH-quinone oxidoreductase subunit C [Candidatus Krumholzibacteriia bacterium]
MNAEEIHQKLRGRFGDGVGELHGETIDPWIEVDPERVDEVARFCKEDPDLGFNFLSNLCGTDAHESLFVVYHLYSYAKRHGVVLKVKVNKGKPITKTVTSVWRGANWFERETFDLFGVRFDGHPDLRRILLPDDWEGYPLRKEYVFPDEYGGIDNTRDYGF